MRLRLAGTAAIPIISLLGLLIGPLVALVIICFRLVIELGQSSFLPAADPENYEQLAAASRWALATGGGLFLGLLFSPAVRKGLEVGIVHVMDRLAHHEAHLPLRNALLQFVGGTLSIICGHSVGREGPSVHLGAALASLLGQRLALPNNSIRTLTACGSAAAIAAAFNTPLAGVIFAMEVVVMEYSIGTLAPVILAAVGATSVARLAFDSSAPLFTVPPLALDSLWELPLIVLMGIGIGMLAVLFIQLTCRITRGSRRLPVWLRFTLAGLATGSIGVFIPQVMGIGYDTIDQVLSVQLGLGLICLILIGKLLATACCIGLGLPAGLIGPVLFIGALAGAALHLCAAFFPVQLSPAGLYVMLGMGAMMSATLQAPLAALLALLELTGNPNLILPGMLALVSANLTAAEVFAQRSIYRAQMRERGLDDRIDPLTQSLHRLGVSAVMNTRFALLMPQLSRTQIDKVLATQPHWLILRRPDRQSHLLMPAADLARYLEEHGPSLPTEEINLLEIPSRRLQLQPIHRQASLHQAWQMLQRSDTEALYVIHRLGVSADLIDGIITPSDIEQSYLLGHRV